jgi:hypothetical protein
MLPRPADKVPIDGDRLVLSGEATVVAGTARIRAATCKLASCCDTVPISYDAASPRRTGRPRLFRSRHMQRPSAHQLGNATNVQQQFVRWHGDWDTERAVWLVLGRPNSESDNSRARHHNDVRALQHARVLLVR